MKREKSVHVRRDFHVIVSLEIKFNINEEEKGLVSRVRAFRVFSSRKIHFRSKSSNKLDSTT